MVTPSFVFFNGEVVPWLKAVVHISLDGVTKGFSVFDALRLYWVPEQQIHCGFRVEDHIERLLRSSKLLGLPEKYSKDYFIDAISALIEALDKAEDFYLRPTIYLESGGYSANPDTISIGCFIYAYSMRRRSLEENTTSLYLSSWKKFSDDCFPTRVKAGGTYLLGRPARVEAQKKGFDSVLLRDSKGYLCESPGANFFIVKNGKLFTTPLNSGILDGITRDSVITLAAQELATETIETNLTDDDILNCDEAFLCGTLDEIKPVLRLNERALSEVVPLTRRLSELYFEQILDFKNDSQNWYSCFQPN